MSAPGETRCLFLGKRIVLLASLLLSILLAVLPAIAPPGGNWRDRALAYADAEHMFGPLQGVGQSYIGSFVRFQFNQSTATITDYTVVARSMSTAVFQSVAPSVPVTGSPSLNGTVFEFSGTDIRILSFNNPTSGLLVNSLATTLNVSFTLSPGVDASRSGKSLNLSKMDLAARLSVTGNASLTLLGFQAVAHLPPGTSAIFRANSVDGENAVGIAGQTLLARAAVDGSLGLESFSVGLEGYVESSDVQYDGSSDQGINLTSTGFLASFQAGQSPSKLVALHLHKSVIAYDANYSYDVRLNGTSITRRASLDEVIADTGTSPAYAIINGQNGTLILLRISDSGSHEFSFQKILPPPVDQGLNPMQIIAVAAIVLVLLGAAATFMLRKRPA